LTKKKQPDKTQKGRNVGEPEEHLHSGAGQNVGVHDMRKPGKGAVGEKKRDWFVCGSGEGARKL